ALVWWGTWGPGARIASIRKKADRTGRRSRTRSIQHPPPERNAAMVSRGAVGVDGGAEQAGLGVQDDGARNRGDEILHRLLRAEGVHEASVADDREELRRDAAADIDARRRRHARREMARFGAVRLDEHVERLTALRAASLRGALGDRARQIGRVVD